MRITKKEFFAQYGLTLNSKGKLFSPWGEWVRLPLTYGSKTHCFGWSMLAGTREWEGQFNGEVVSTSGTCVCQCEDCYASCGRYVMPSVVDANMWRTMSARLYPEWLEKAIVAQINWGKNGKPLEMVRVHISGDFFSDDYVSMWHRIAERCENTRFWAYTKVSEYETRFDDLERFNIVRSVLPDGSFNFGKIEEILAKKAMLESMGIETHICRCAVDKGQKCNNCTACQKLKYVLFLLHGNRDYKPEKEESWEGFVEVVESQKPWLSE